MHIDSVSSVRYLDIEKQLLITLTMADVTSNVQGICVMRAIRAHKKDQMQHKQLDNIIHNTLIDALCEKV